MAQKKRPKRRWLKALLFYIFSPLLIWSLAFVVWLYWSDLTKLFGKDTGKTTLVPKTSRGGDKTERPDSAPANRPQEKILEEDRKKLDDILKGRQ
jgi:hypothetical protein